MAFEFTTEPSFTGIAQVGSTLVATPGVVGGGTEPYTEISSEWQEKIGDADWTTKTTELSFIVGSDDVDRLFRYRNAWEDDAGADVKASTTEIGPVSAVFFDCALASPTATSYVCLAEAEAILRGTIQSEGLTDWYAMSDDDKKRSLNLATSALEALDWKGTKCSCEQRLQWPRHVNDCQCPLATCSDTPFDIKTSCAYMAAFLAQNPVYGSLGGGGGSGENSQGGGSGGNDQVAGLEPFSEVQIGPIAVKMRQDADFSVDGVWGWELLPPYLKGILQKWIDGFQGDGSIGQGTIRRGSVARRSPRLPWQVPGTLWVRGGRVYPRYQGSGRDWGNY